MATATISGSTVVFSNSTAAANLTNTTNEDATGFLTFDVLAASGGGTKTTIYSVDDGINSTNLTVNNGFTGYNTDLLSKDCVNVVETTSKGGQFWIGSDAKLHYNAANVTGMNALAEGETLTDTFQYTIRMANGTLSVGTINVVITGINDAAQFSGDVTGCVVEDSGTAATGLLTVVDADHDQSSFQAASFDTAYGSFTIDTAGHWSFNLDNTDPDVQALSVDETMKETVTVKSFDGTEKTICITIKGDNDAPSITSVEQIGEVTEDDVLVASGQVTASDVDTHDVLSYSTDDTSDYGSFDLNASTGEWTFTLDNDAHQNLAKGESHDEIFTITVSDGHGGTKTQDVTVTVTGVNDTPTADDATDSGDEDTVITGSLSQAGHDVDDGAVLSFSTADTIAGFNLNANGSYTLDTAVAAYQHLAAGDTMDVVVHYTVTDEHGAHSDASLTITVTGDNDAPVAVADTNSGNEDTLITGSVAANDSDADESATLTYELDAPVAGLTLSPDGSYSFDASDAAYQYLAEGVSTDVVVHYTVTDEHGASSDASLTITITGTNDVPVASAATNAVDEDATVSGNVSATDADAGETAGLIYALVDDAPPGLTFHPNGSYSFDASSYDYLPAGETMTLTIGYTATDGHGASDTSTLTITITGTNDAAVISGNASGSVVEAIPGNAGVSTATGTLHATDIDNADDVFQVVSTAATSLGGYGLFTVTADGQWTYTLNNANSTVDALSNGGILNDSFVVYSEDGTAKTVNVTINGATDAAVVVVAAPYTGPDADPNNFDNFIAAGAVAFSTISTSGLNGNNSTYGTAGNDTMDVKNGNDTVYGWAGNDTIIGGEGVDVIYGGSGNDIITGGQDVDTIYAGSGSDTVAGSQASDIIIGGYGADNLTGDSGDDTFRYLNTRDTGDTITDFTGAGVSGGDLIDLSALANVNSFGGTTADDFGVWFSAVGPNVTVYVDTDGNTSTAEMVIYLTNVTNLDGSDFIL
jgi:VCBS repeat-containing protein